MKKFITNILFGSETDKIKLNQKATIFAFCLLLSTFFWFLSALSKNYTTTLSIPLSYSTLSDSFILTEEPPKTINIEVSGSGFELLGEQMSLNRSEVMVDLNMARKVYGENYGLPTRKLEKKILIALDRHLTLRQIITDSLKFKTQKKESKLVKVIPVTQLDFEAGFNIRGKLNTIPDSVIISGPKEIVEQTNSIKTVEFKRNEIEDSISVKVTLDRNSINEQLYTSTDQVELFVPVEKFTEKMILTPVKVESQLKDIEIKIYPKEAKVYLLVPLNKYELTKSNSISAKVIFEEQSKGKQKLRVKLAEIPEYAKLIRVEPEYLEFIIKK